MKVIAVLAALLLAACAGEEGSVRDIRGTNIGKPKQVQIDPAESHLQLPPSFLPVEKAIRGSLPDRTFESLVIKGGYIELEQAAGAAYADDIPDRKFRAMFKSIEKQGGSGDAIILEPKRSYPITFAKFTLSGKPCLAFVRPIGAAVPNVRGIAAAHEGAVSRFFCDASGQVDFTARALGYIREIRLRRPGDGGASRVLGAPPAEPPLRSQHQVQAYLDQNRPALRRALNAYNNEHAALVGNNGKLLYVKQIKSIEIRKLDGDRVFVETSFTTGKRGSNWTGGAGTLLFELQWTEDELAFIGHSQL